MNEKVKKLLDELLKIENITADDVPNIELYMDQVTTFMETHLADTKRYPDDKVMTKTMVNNYTKNHLLPPSNKKKYSKEHIFLLIMIYYYKNVLSISDIQQLLTPLTENYFPANKKNGLSLEEIYSIVMNQMDESKENIQNQILDTLEKSNHLFDPLNLELTQEDNDVLSTYALISQLCYDITLRKQLIEKLIDQVYSPVHDKTKKAKVKNKNEK